MYTGLEDRSTLQTEDTRQPVSKLDIGIHVY
jgi:hypothetical protein